MAKKAKTLNPADAFRKAQRQKEIKRNKLERKKAREDANSKKDSSTLQAEINQLERLAKPTISEQNRLKETKHQLSLILKAKEQKGITSSNDPAQSASKVIIDPATGLPSVSHDDSKNDGDKNTQSVKSSSNSRTMNWFGPDGKLLEPERSFYYHPVFNPFGVPPPGMPMRMKDNITNLTTSNSTDPNKSPSQPPTQTTESDHDASDNESESEEDKSVDQGTEDDDGDDIPLPEGSPPALESEDEQEDDDIPLPEGSPPPKPIERPPSVPLINRPTKSSPNLTSQSPHANPGFVGQPAPFFPPPISLVPGLPPPPMIAGMSMMTFPLGPNGLPLPPPPISNFHSLPLPPISANLPPKPITTTTTGLLNKSAHKSDTTVPPTSKPTLQASATVTALPQLRDLKREATNFVPAAIRKKRKELDRRAGIAGLGDGNRIQAAPNSLDSGHDNGAESQEPKQLTTTLLAALKRDGVVSDSRPGKASTHAASAAHEKDDYEKFVESLGDVL
ncbi:hypothetical protein PCANC_14230 [Puccinia coronata f. sp. avenae]|uniref:Wbp11/ELF5/Saf1 N-terminal domain-containing protein n=1 Tax=Puccinia coronata f. sp. avenae TaxID=200324 RepID=A0A2N5UQL4_9BASI|nr:hypothetical protein PCANC_14230 [Puccinia coronata f. sp. avenae]